MYNAYWGLKDKPFENTPDPRFTYFTPQHEEGLSRLLYAVREGKGAAMMTGVFGCGKTLLGHVLLKELEKDIYRTAFLVNPQMDYLELLMAIATALGERDLPVKRTEILANVALNKLQTILQNNARDGKRTVVIIDEAHVIEERVVWEGLRLLMNFQEETRCILTLIFLGQPELREKIDTNKQLSQRIPLRCHLEPLSQEQTKAYILHRLKVVGREEPLFLEEVFPMIYDKSGGIPRRINNLCDLVLLNGFGKKTKQVDTACLQEAVRDIEG